MLRFFIVGGRVRLNVGYRNGSENVTFETDSRFFYFKLCRGYSNVPLRLAIHVIQNPPNGEQKSHWDMTKEISISCPSATYALQQGGFVPREWLTVSSKCQLKAIFPGVVLEKTLDFWIQKSTQTLNIQNEFNWKSFILSEFDVNAKKWFSYDDAPRPARLVLKRRRWTNYCVLI